MQLVDARRLTGPNLLSRSPQVVVELALDASDDLQAVAGIYSSELERMSAALQLPSAPPFNVRSHRGGTVLGYDAPIDIMLACAEMSEWAALSARELVAGRPALPIEPKRTEVAQLLLRDRSPRLVAMAAEARRREIPLLWDDERVSLGAGLRSRGWPRTALPDPGDVPWDDLGTIPIALVTGTNGKTTATRLLARIAREAGLRVGSTSSDEIAVGTEVIETGDWTGPAAARTVLRRQDIDFAVLETARGGILRRGLAIADCDAALITNVSDDHLGSYGIDDLESMTRVKAVAAEAVRPSGTVVLNAHDPKLVALATSLRGRVVFFADLGRDDPEARAVIARHRAGGGRCVIAEAGQIFVASGEHRRSMARLDAVPITFGGAAGYNVENAAAVVAMAGALGIGDEAIARGLSAFEPSDNPRRGELVERRGVRVLLDFGHNPDGIRSVMRLVRSLRVGTTGRLTVIAGAAGDRSDHDIEAVARSILEAEPDRVLLRDLQGYLRGRAPGEVPRLLERALAAGGCAAETVPSEVAALRCAFESARPGDFIVLLVFLELDEVHAFLRGLGG